ncbi:MAG: aminotransferase class I/II-fold pyridoxal phosphate-dependent enzyme [Gammaproteobacteria bacterium]|nr:aminotransferase class I/II-fold pyridoxal phosphate-dependent enzyme [Gammaproteobacteria bacterium]
MKQQHGGRLHAACQTYGGTPEQWVDLSTGIAPWAYPLPMVPESVWQRLPETEDGLIDIAAHYYSVHPTECLAIAGSQWAIEQIPYCYSDRLVVLMLANGYSEHPRAWRNAGHNVIEVSDINELIAQSPNCDACVLIQPHNPLGFVLSEIQLQQIKHNLRQGIMVIDEAFADSSPTPTLPLTHNTWKLRSIGKFFGLAGIRLGFVLATHAQIKQMNLRQSPWSVSHLARWAGKQALQDTPWQDEQRMRLKQHSNRLSELLVARGVNSINQTDYFVTITSEQSQAWVESAAQSQLLLRHLPAIHGIRFGLSANEIQWNKLTEWLSRQKHHC